MRFRRWVAAVAVVPILFGLAGCGEKQPTGYMPSKPVETASP